MVFVMHQRLEKMQAQLNAERGAREQLKKTLAQTFAEMLIATGLDPEAARKSSEELAPEIAGKEAEFHTTFTKVAAAASAMARNLEAANRENARYRSGKGHAFADSESRLAPADSASAAEAGRPNPAKRAHQDQDTDAEFLRGMPTHHFDPHAGENRAVTRRLANPDTRGSEFVRQSRAELRRLYSGGS